MLVGDYELVVHGISDGQEWQRLEAEKKGKGPRGKGNLTFGQAYD